MGLTSKPFQSYRHLPNEGTFLRPKCISPFLQCTDFLHYAVPSEGQRFPTVTETARSQHSCSPSSLELGPRILSEHLATWNKDIISQPPLQLSMAM